jgi:hypothetical protein
MTENINAENINVDEIDDAEQTLTVEEVVEDLFEKVDEAVGPYEMWKLIIAAMDVFEYAGKRPTSQYLYNYSRNSLIEKGRGPKNRDHQYSKDAAKAFVLKYLSNRIS